MKRNMNKKSIILLVSLVLLLTLTVGGTLAFLFDIAGPVKNTFNPSEVTCDVIETVNPEKTQKTNVMIQNTGDTEAFIRAAIVINWADGNGNIYGKTPIKDSDYALDLNLSADGWVEGKDGYYYWTKPVAPDAKTGVLINSVKLNDGVKVPEGYALSVEILCSAVQSVPATAVEAWSGGLYTVDKVGTADAVLKAN